MCVLTLLLSEHAPSIVLWLELHQLWASQHLYNKSPAYSCRCYITQQGFTDAKQRTACGWRPNTGPAGVHSSSTRIGGDAAHRCQYRRKENSDKTCLGLQKLSKRRDYCYGDLYPLFYLVIMYMSIHVIFYCLLSFLSFTLRSSYYVFLCLLTVLIQS